MSKSSPNVNVFSSQAYGVWSAPLATAFPVDPSIAPAAGWVEVGLLSDNGVTEEHTVNETDIFDLAGSLVRVARNQEQRPWTFEALEGNKNVDDLRYPTTVVATATNLNTRPVGVGTGRNLKAFLIRLQDGGVHKQIQIANGEAQWTGTVTYSGGAAAIYQFTLQPYKDSNGNYYTVLDDAPGNAATYTALAEESDQPPESGVTPAEAPPDQQSAAA